MQHVCRRSGNYHFRRRVPLRFLERLGGRSEIYRSLETTSPREAAVRSRLLFLESERFFAALEQDAGLAGDEAQSLLRDLVGPAAWVNADIYRRLPPVMTGTAPSPTSMALVERPIDDATQKPMEPPATAVAPDPLTATALAQAMAIVASAMRLVPSLSVADPAPVPLDGISPSPLSAPAQPIVPLSPPPPTLKAPPFFSDLTESHIEQMLGTGAWGAEQTAMQNRSTFRLWLEFHGDRPVDKYTRRDASAFMDALRKLPRLHGRSPQLRGTMQENIKAAATMAKGKGEPPPLLSMMTIKRHISGLHGYWDWLRQHGHHEFAENPFAGFDFPSSKRASEQRSMWSDDELERLFKSRIWAGPEVDRRSAAYWLPLFGLLTGLRLEEASQLHLADLRQRDGIDYILVHGEGDRRTKNANSVREVPIPDALRRLGFMDLVAERRRMGSRLLWSDLRPKGKDRRLGAYYSERFTEYRREIGVYQPGLDFHSLRGTFETLVLNAGANAVFVKSIMGHSTSDIIGEGSRYLKHVTLKNKLEAMNMLTLGIDLEHLMPPIAP